MNTAHEHPKRTTLMDQKSLLMLEYPEVIKRLSYYASFPASEQIALQLQPKTDAEWIVLQLAKVTEARRLLSVNDDIRLGGCKDLRPLMDIARKKGTLEAKSFADIAYTLIIARDLHRSLTHHEAAYPHLAAIAKGISPPAGLIERINQTINERGDVLDFASEKLSSIRREIHQSYNRLVGRLEKILRDERYQTMLQEGIITQRNGRYVIPLKAEFKGQLKSIIHDQSSSGATIFVEPLATVELNNAYQEMQLAERNEVLRILHDLTLTIGGYAGEICRIVDGLAEIDFTLMCAKYADDIRAAEPVLVPPQRKSGHPVLKFYEARHPLLSVESAIPIDVVLNDETFAVVITGPNTGGKTVSLKTVGLLILMAQAGLHIPVQSGSEFSLYQNVFADIGDEQSIEQSLSTFSGHITNIIRILNFSTSKTLVLFDELGSGTDPQEGAALARAILQHLIQRHIPCFVATHFSELKAFAHTTPGAVNASMEFNLKTLRPTYRLSIGLPGRSNALLIAERLGLSADILADARQLIDPAELNAETLLDEIHRQHDAARKARAHADRIRSLAENERRELQKKLEEIDHEREKILAQTYEETTEEIQDLRDELSQLRKAYLHARLPLQQLKPLEAALKDHAGSAKKIAGKMEKKIQKQFVSAVSVPLMIGEKVRVRGLGTDSLALITAIDKEEAEIQLGNLRMRVPLVKLFRKTETEELDNEKPRSAQQEEKSSRSVLFYASPGSEIDLRGEMAEEALSRLDQYLDQAVLARLPFVRIIHGKGTGKLRQVTRQTLLDSPHVKFIERGKDSEGGEGVTIAHLKD